jgi:hypothetical protein
VPRRFIGDWQKIIGGAIDILEGRYPLTVAEQIDQAMPLKDQQTEQPISKQTNDE